MDARLILTDLVRGFAFFKVLLDLVWCKNLEMLKVAAVVDVVIRHQHIVPCFEVQSRRLVLSTHEDVVLFPFERVHFALQILDL